MTTQQAPRLEARLRNRQALRDAMAFNRLTVRDLAMCCGNPGYRSTIGHLLTGARSTCNSELAKRIEKCLRLDAGALFALRVTSDQTATPDPKTHTRGRRKAA